MIELIIFCLFASFVICGLHFSSIDGGVLSFLRYPFDRAEDRTVTQAMYDNFGMSYKIDKLIAFIGKPIIVCAKCMASIWGTLLYWFWFEDFVITEWICVVLCISFFNAFWSILYYRS